MEWVFHFGDVLIIAGAIDRIFDLQSVYGLSHIAETDAMLWEAATSKEATVTGQAIRDSNFRSFYNGNILAVHRNGESLHTRLGDIRIMPGDTLLILAEDDFYSRWNNSHEFSLVGEALIGYDNKQKQKFPTAVPLIFMGVVIIGGIFTASIAVFTFVGVAILLLDRYISPSRARDMLDLKALLTIARDIGLAGVLEKNEFAERVIRTLFQVLPEHSPFISLLGVHFDTNILTSFITNNAAALISLPVTLEEASQLNVSSTSFIVVVTVTASACFMTSIGYQANVILSSAAGYEERDFVRIGFPLTLVYGAFAIAVIPGIWHF
ncbi:MAG: TrkA C-terminal domain-containing protein [Turneriella sp.]